MSSSKASSATRTPAVKVEDPNPNPDPGFLAPASSAGAALTAAGPSSDAFRPPAPSASASVESDLEDEYLHGAEALTREEVLRRRSRHVKQLSRLYRRQYWALIEELRVRHRDYYWEFGASPFEVAEEAGGSQVAPAENGAGDSTDAPAVGGGGQENGGPFGFGFEGEGVGMREVRKKCAYAGCKSKAMPLTRYCHPHILSDKRQKLYKPCIFIVKSCGQSGPVMCAKPVTSGADPCVCPTHFERYQRSISQAMKRAGVNVSSSKPYFKLNLLVAEYVHQIQANRREALNANNTEESPMDDENAS